MHPTQARRSPCPAVLPLKSTSGARCCRGSWRLELYAVKARTGMLAGPPPQCFAMKNCLCRPESVSAAALMHVVHVLLFKFAAGWMQSENISLQC